MRTILAAAPTLWRDPSAVDSLALLARDIPASEVLTFAGDPVGRAVARRRNLPVRDFGTWQEAVEHADALASVDDFHGGMALVELVKAAKSRALRVNDARME